MNQEEEILRENIRQLIRHVKQKRSNEEQEVRNTLKKLMRLELKKMLSEAYVHYHKAFDDKNRFEQGYWDGSIRQLHYMLELHGK